MVVNSIIHLDENICQKGRPKRRCIYAVRENAKVVGVRTDDADDRVRRRKMTHCGDPWTWTSRKKKKDGKKVVTQWYQNHTKREHTPCLNMNVSLAWERSVMTLHSETLKWKISPCRRGCAEMHVGVGLPSSFTLFFFSFECNKDRMMGSKDQARFQANSIPLFHISPP